MQDLKNNSLQIDYSDCSNNECNVRITAPFNITVITVIVNAIKE